MRITWPVIINSLLAWKRRRKPRQNLKMKTTINMKANGHTLNPTVTIFPYLTVGSICHFLSLVLSPFLYSYSLKGLNNRTADLCYSIRHFELHGRELDDPWSCRQSAIHQKYYFTNGHSRWIIVQPPILFTNSLKNTEFSQITKPIGLHL
jgi:hypothetical protein